MSPRPDTNTSQPSTQDHLEQWCALMRQRPDATAHRNHLTGKSSVHQTMGKIVLAHQACSPVLMMSKPLRWKGATYCTDTHQASRLTPSTGTLPCEGLAAESQSCACPLPAAAGALAPPHTFPGTRNHASCEQPAGGLSVRDHHSANGHTMASGRFIASMKTLPCTRTS